jgi:hypothetical protein
MATIKFEYLAEVLDSLTVVEVLKTGEGVIYRGMLKDMKPNVMASYEPYKIIPCATSRETYLEIDVL